MEFPPHHPCTPPPLSSLTHRPPFLHTSAPIGSPTPSAPNSTFPQTAPHLSKRKHTLSPREKTQEVFNFLVNFPTIKWGRAFFPMLLLHDRKIIGAMFFRQAFCHRQSHLLRYEKNSIVFLWFKSD